MDVTQLPFNQLVGLQSEAEASGWLVSLPAGAQHMNHVGTLHACALLTVAEAGSGIFLQRKLGSAAGYVPVVRRLQARFRKPAVGWVAARANLPDEVVAGWAAQLATRGKLTAEVPVEVVDGNGTVVLTAEVEWFIARAPATAT